MIIFFLSLSVFWAIIWFFVALVRKRNDVADIAWGLFPIFFGCMMLLFSENFFSVLSFPSFPFPLVFWISFAVIIIWGLRLSFHIFLRNIQSAHEDARYLKWRNEWKFFYLRSFFQIFLLQSFLSLILSLPLYFAFFASDFLWIHWFGIILFSFGFILEMQSDMQLKKFLIEKKEGKITDKILTTGLWKYSRHPNYLGEILLWWGVFIMTFHLSTWMFTIFSPLLVSILIIKISGVPMAERDKKGKEWEEYKKNTPALFPRILRKQCKREQILLK